MRIKITEQQLKTLRENVNSIEIEDNKLENVIMEAVRSVLTEGQILVDNFDMVYKLLEFNPNGDDFYFVQIIKRYKDNPNDDKRQGNYRNGAWYLNSWRIHSVDELKQLRPQIINICNQNNARAYITINPRSTQETDNYINYLKRKLGPNAQNIEDRVAGAPKHGDNWKNSRLRFFYDGDTKIGRDQAEAKDILKMCGFTPIGEYKTPSGGIHILMPDKNAPNLQYVNALYRKFDDWKDLGRLATFHANYDGKIILYSNVQTKGY